MSTKNTNFWKSLAKAGKSLLAHVNITFDGATGAIHIEIVPAREQPAPLEQQKTVSNNQVALQQLPDAAMEQQEPGGANQADPEELAVASQGSKKEEKRA